MHRVRGRWLRAVLALMAATLSVLIGPPPALATPIEHGTGGPLPVLGDATERVISEIGTLTPLARLQPAGALQLTKTITGAAAGSQGSVTIRLSCTGQDPIDWIIDAGAIDAQSRLFTSIPAGTVCTVTEPVNGAGERSR
jgi:hypothetical protein